MKILIGIPTHDNRIHIGLSQNLIQIALKTSSKGDDLSIQYPCSPFISFNRNLIISQAIKDYVDWVLKVDSDIEVPQECLYKMIDEAYRNNAALLGLAVKIKSIENEYACAEIKDGEYVRLKDVGKKIRKIDVVGAGVSLINMKWLRSSGLQCPWYEFRDGKKEDIPTISPEDWEFCRKIKSKKGKIFLLPTIETIHHGLSYWHHNL